MKQQPLLGFLFALITAMAWGSLPIALKQVLSVMTPQTIVWYRFIVAFLALFILLAYKKKIATIFERWSIYLVGSNWCHRVVR